MPMHPNFEARTPDDLQAQLAAITTVLRVILEKHPVDLDRVHQLLTTATGDDVNLRARARWFVDYIAGNFSAEGDRP